MEGKCTVYFEDPYWVCFCEIEDEIGYRVARFVFGKEPGQAELLKFAREEYQHLKYSQAITSITWQKQIMCSYKRRKKQVKKTIAQHGVGTKAQQAYKFELERLESAKKVRQQTDTDLYADELFDKRMWKKKQKHKGR